MSEETYFCKDRDPQQAHCHWTKKKTLVLALLENGLRGLTPSFAFTLTADALAFQSPRFLIFAISTPKSGFWMLGDAFEVRKAASSVGCAGGRPDDGLAKNG